MTGIEQCIMANRCRELTKRLDKDGCLSGLEVYKILFPEMFEDPVYEYLRQDDLGLVGLRKES